MKVGKLLPLLLSVLMVLGCMPGSLVLAENEPSDYSFYGDMNFDVVFVADASGSMAYADEGMLEPEVMHLFVDMCDAASCRAGYVVYSHVLNDSHDLTPLNDPAGAAQLKEGFDRITYESYADTDIALGLKEAMQILERGGGDESRNPMIILLSDGKTDLPKGPRTVAESEAELETTLHTLTERGIPVYTIGINFDGSLDSETMQRIADNTGGKKFETASASELHSIIINIFADYSKIVPEEVQAVYNPDSGMYTADINVDNSSIYCANIVVQSSQGISNPQLFSPGGYNVALGNDKIIVTNSRTYTLIKMIFPEVGTWKLQVMGAGEDDIHISLLKSYSMSVSQTLSTTHATATESVNVTASLNTDEGIITDQDLITMLVATTDIRNKNTNEATQLLLDNNMDGTFSADFVPSGKGEYELITTIRANDGSFEKISKPAVLYAEDLWIAEQTRAEMVLSENSVKRGSGVEMAAYLFNGVTGEYITERAFVSGCKAVCRFTSPSGETSDVEMVLGEDGFFRGAFTPSELGSYQAAVYISSTEPGIKVSPAVGLECIKCEPTALRDVKVTVRSAPFATKAEFNLSDYAEWDAEDTIFLTEQPLSSDFFTIEKQQTGNDILVTVTGGKNSGEDAAELIIINSDGLRCSVMLYVETTSGTLWFLGKLAVVLVILLVAGILVYLILPKVQRSVISVAIHVPPEIADMLPSVQEVALRSYRHSISLQRALNLRTNAFAKQNLDPVIKEMKLDQLLKDIRITAHAGRRLSVTVRVNSGSRFVNEQEITRTQTFHLGQRGSGEFCVIQCGESGDIVISY